MHGNATHRSARQHPVFRILMVDEGRKLRWLAEKTGYSYPSVKAFSANLRPIPARFRAACAALCGLPESALFLPDVPDHAAASANRPAQVATVPDSVHAAAGGCL